LIESALQANNEDVSIVIVLRLVRTKTRCTKHT